MAISDLNEIPIEHSDHKQKNDMCILNPINEPVIGVIDTLFCEDVYFHEWVDNHNELDDRPEVINEHGTLVTSIIVDGPQLNPQLNGHCGRFKVRHFGVCNDKINHEVSIESGIIQSLSHHV